jgi:protein involved in temperature-dependent protein secretion
MAHLSFMLSRALAGGRADKGVPRSRAEILAALLRKRAEAHRQGLRDQEEKLRDQILWALPMHSGEAADGAPAGETSPDWTCAAQS